MHTSISQLMDQYDVLLIDAFGVLVHNQAAYPGAAAFIDKLNAMAKPYFILTNGAARLPENGARGYQSRGLAITADKIISSGSLLKRFFADHDLVGKRCFVLGTEDSRAYVEQAGGTLATLDSIESAEVLVVADGRGFDFLPTMEVVISWLLQAYSQDNQIPLILPNPDLLFPKTKTSVGITSGSCALVIEHCLRTRLRFLEDPIFSKLGKPHHHIFDEAKRRSPPNSRFLMIGDQLDTDIYGAIDSGIDSALVLSGVATRASLTNSSVKPTYVLENLL